MSAPMSSVHRRDVRATPLANLSRGLSVIEGRVAAHRAAAEARRVAALAGLGHLPED